MKLLIIRPSRIINVKRHQSLEANLLIISFDGHILWRRGSTSHAIVCFRMAMHLEQRKGPQCGAGIILLVFALPAPAQAGRQV